MSNKIVRLTTKDGGIAQGTKVQLSDGSFLGGIQSIKLAADTDNPMWRMTVDIHPKFIEQVPLEVELNAVNIGNIDSLTDEQLKSIGLQRINHRTSKTSRAVPPGVDRPSLKADF